MAKPLPDTAQAAPPIGRQGVLRGLMLMYLQPRVCVSGTMGHNSEWNLSVEMALKFICALQMPPARSENTQFVRE